MSDGPTTQSEASTVPPIRPRGHAVGLQSFFNNKKHSDLTLTYGKYGEHIFLGHKVILCSKSMWFDVCLGGHFVESEDSKITLRDDDDDPNAIESMLRFAYEMDFPEPAVGLMDRVDEALRLFAVAQKYLMPDLEIVASERFDRALVQYIAESCTTTIGNIVTNHKPILNEGFRKVVLKTYALAGGVRTTRYHLLVNTVIKHMGLHNFAVRKGSPEHAYIIEMASENAEFGRDLLLGVFDRALTSTANTVQVTAKVRCPVCNGTWDRCKQAGDNGHCERCGAQPVRPWREHTYANWE